MTDPQAEALQTAREQYNRYIETGFQMTPPFKGFAIEHLWFAMDEPECYKLLFINDKHFDSIDDLIDYEGHKDMVLESVHKTFGLEPAKALELYKQLWVNMFGMVSVILNSTFPMSISEISKRLGFALRGCMLSMKAGEDERIGFIPSNAGGPTGNVAEYIDKGVHEIGRRNNALMLQTLIGQNRLLKSLHSEPRYVRDNEWNELDRLTQGGFGISRRSLAQSHPVLTAGDVRLIILEKLGFGVSISAILLGISPASVTKTRQRLKAKLEIESVDEFVKDL